MGGVKGLMSGGSEMVELALSTRPAEVDGLEDCFNC